MRVRLDLVDGQQVYCLIDPDACVLTLKLMIYEWIGLKPEIQRLMFPRVWGEAPENVVLRHLVKEDESILVCYSVALIDEDEALESSQRF